MFHTKLSRKATAEKKEESSSAYILDNGAYTAKCGYSRMKEPKIIPNCIMKVKSERRRAFIADQIDECTDASGLFYQLPFQRGYIINWDIQKAVWDHIFSGDCCQVDFTETPLIITEPIFNFPSLKQAMTEIFFEDFDCCSLYRTNATDLSCFKYNFENKSPLCTLVVDSGFSFTHIVPYIDGKKYKQGIIRMDVGGKVLTNQLKEIISYRQLNVMDETHVMNQCKEDCCYVSLNFMEDMKKTVLKGKNNPIVADYVLPDYSTIRRGYLQTVKDDESSEMHQQILRMNNERISIPEILFHPSDIGLKQMGIAECIFESINRCPEPTRPHLFENIVLTGGNAKFPNFRDRLEADVRAMTPEEYDVKIFLPSDPMSYAWHGGVTLSNSAQFPIKCVTRDEYMELGMTLVNERFDV